MLCRALLETTRGLFCDWLQLRGGLLCSGLGRDGGAPHSRSGPKGGHREPLAYICLIHSSLINPEGGGRERDKQTQGGKRERREKRVRSGYFLSSLLAGSPDLAGSFNQRAQLHQRSQRLPTSQFRKCSLSMPLHAEGDHSTLLKKPLSTVPSLYLSSQKRSLTKLHSNYPFSECHPFPDRTVLRFRRVALSNKKNFKPQAGHSI